ncbi:hypothetical protein ABPG77_010945 [Micractinium sp. CCAP 211/92]
MLLGSEAQWQKAGEYESMLLPRVFADQASPLSSLPSGVKAVEDGSLTAGASAAFSFRLDAGKPSEVFCASWDAGSQDWVNNTDLGPIRGPGPTRPPKSEYARQAGQLCAAGAAGGAALASAFTDGGSEARAALAALLWGTCSDPDALSKAYSAFLNSTELANATTALLIADNLVKAAGELGLAACASLVTLDREGNVLDSETLHTASRQGSAGSAPAPGPGPAAASSSDEPLPDGKVRVVISASGRAANCLDYSPGSADRWVNDSMPAWRGTGSATPDVLDEFALDLCNPLKAEGSILDALAAGGNQARVAVAALLTDACNNQAATDAAFQAFLGSPEMSNTSTVLDYAGSFVEACDELGYGCCFTVVVLDPSTGDVLATRKIHTSGGSPSQAVPPTSPVPSTPFKPPASPPAPAGSGTTLEQCKVQLAALSSGCARSSIGPGTPCCDSVLALGNACLVVLAQAAVQPGADPVFAEAVNTLLSKCAPAQGGGPPAVGASPPSPAAPPAGASCQGDPLSQFMAALAKCNATSLAPGTPCCNGIQALGGTCLGEVLAAVASNATKAYLTGIARLFLSVGSQSAACYTYSPSAGRFVSSMPPVRWGASAEAIPGDAEIAAAIDQLCQGSAAGDAFVQAVGQGGASARAWVAAWLLANCTAAEDATQAFFAAIVARGPNAALKYAQNWVDASQQLGIGACFTVTSLDSSSGSVLGEVQVHTNLLVSAPPEQGNTIPLRFRRLAFPA